MRVVASVLAVTALVGLTGSLGGKAATADTGPPAVNAGPPPDGRPAPLEKTKQHTACWNTRKNDDTATEPPSQRYLDFRSAWPFSRGRGQTVAVIDTGVARHPRLTVNPGGDYVGDTDGTQDCDVHGTVVAGIVAAHDDGSQGFVGVAPDASVISVRQYSFAFESEAAGRQRQPGEPGKGYGPAMTLALAIRHAVDMGATVMNISLTSCDTRLSNDDAAVGAAVKYASERAVVVAAAGNFQDGECPKGNSNIIDPLHPDKSPWENATTISSPCHYSQFVLCVGSVDPTSGMPSSFTVPGPWLGVAAPGEQIVSLDPRGSGLTSGTMDDKGKGGSLQGTSFAAPYVAGIAALVRSRFPQLRPFEVIQRIKQTAHAPGGGWNPYIGYGIVDPMAAVTAELPPDSAAASFGGSQLAQPKSEQLPVLAPPPPPDHRARNAALIGTAAVIALLTLGMLASFPIRRRLQPPQDD